jgi:hypothetical protein
MLGTRTRSFLKKFALGVVLSASCIALLAYVADYAVYRYRLSSNRQPFGQVTVTSYDAVAQKSGKVQFIFNPPQAVTCVNSLFPHSGYAPCWYLQQHSEQRTDI